MQVYAGTDENGKKRFVYRTVKAPDTRAGEKVADRELARLVLEVENGEAVFRTEMTFGEFLDRWLAFKASDWSPTSVYYERLRVDNHVRPALGSLYLPDLNARRLDGFYRDLADDGLSASTIGRIHTVIRSALNQAVKWDLIVSNPALKASPPKVELPDLTIPSPEEVGRLLDAAGSEGEDFVVFLRLAATTGARRGELCALRWEDVEWDQSALWIRRSVAKQSGGLTVKSTKTGRGRLVALDPDTLELLSQWRRTSAKRHMECGEPLEWVFTAVPGQGPWYPDSITRRFVRVAESVGLSHLRLKELRHYVATWGLIDGLDARTVANRLGHASPTTTLNRYTRAVGSQDREAATRLAARL